MKIVLVTLSGDAIYAHAELCRRWPDAEIVDVPKSLLEHGGLPKRLATVRRLKPDVFAVMTEALSWQYGQEALMYLGSLAGAANSVVLDARERSVIAKRSSLLATSPIRIANGFLRGRAALRRAESVLAKLDQIETTRLTGSYGPADLQHIKVAYFRTTPSAGTVPGGATSHINGVTKALRELGADVEFVSNDIIAGIDASAGNFHILETDQNVMPRSAFDVANGLVFADQASRLTAQLEPSFIYERYSRFSIAGVEASIRNGVPLFLEYNGSEVWAGENWDNTADLDLLERYELTNLGFAHRIFVISDIEKNNLLERGVPEANIVVNPNGVDPEKFRPHVGGTRERADLQIGSEEILAGFLGTFGQWHGVLALAEAIALIPKDSHLKFLLVGDGRLREEVQKRLAASNDLDRVIFTGSVPHERVPALLDACDILLSPHVPLADGTEFFGSPTKLFEYLAMGKGIVASRLGQIGDVLEDRRTALLVEPGDAEQLSRGVQELANDAELRARLGRASRAAAVDRHSWRRNAELVLETYRTLS